MDESIIKETLRYLGYGNEPADERTLEMVRQCAGLLAGRCRPRHISRMVNLSHADSPEQVCPEGMQGWKSESLGRALTGCSQMMVFGATLGIEADMLINREASRDISRGAVMAAAASAFIEDYCDKVCAELAEELKSQGHTLGERFSPGYGDFELEHQKDIFAILDCENKIGLTLTENLIMIPTKSVTAIMAIDGNCGKQLGCEFCAKTDCLYRRR